MCKSIEPDESSHSHNRQHRKTNASDEIVELVQNVRENYEEALEAIREGKAF